MYKALFFIIVFSINVFSQNFESRFFGGINLPIGAELGFISETDLPKIDVLKILAKSSIMWSPVFSEDDKFRSLLILGLQPGIRARLLNDRLYLSGGLSINPVFPLPFDGMSFGLGSFLGASVRIRAVELGLYGTTIFNHNRYTNDFRWLSITVSKGFPLLNLTSNGK